MSDFIEVYSHKSRKPEYERWACRKCENIVDAPHKEGPPNGVCTCPNCMSMAGIPGYDDVAWETPEGKFIYEHNGNKLIIRFKENDGQSGA